jgi:hypothetical protein
LIITSGAERLPDLFFGDRLVTNRTVINGKVMRTPTLSRYDGMVPKPEPVFTAATATGEFNQQFVKDGGRTWERDKAELVAFGVDGDVPLAQAWVNAGLDAPPGYTLRDWRWLVRQIDAGLIGANDNHKIAAKAA